MNRKINQKQPRKTLKNEKQFDAKHRLSPPRTLADEINHKSHKDLKESIRNRKKPQMNTDCERNNLKLLLIVLPLCPW